MKKFLVIVLALMLVLTVFAGCTTTDDAKDESSSTKEETKKEETKKEETAPEEDMGPTPGVYPIEGGYEFTYWTGLSGNTAPHYENFAETPFYKQVFADTGVTVKFEHPVQGQAKESLNLLIASGDYPDLIEYNWIADYPGGPAKAMDDGFMLDLTDIIPEYAPGLYGYLQSLPKVDKMVKTDAGQYFCFPFIRDTTDSSALLVFFGPIIRENFLMDLGIDAPETMDDWYAMLTAFKTDLNIEVPLTYQWNFMNTAMNFVSAYDTVNDFYQRDGKIQFGPAEPQFKEFLTEYSKWYAEGLIDPDIATQDKAQCTAKITGGQTGATLGYTASRLGAWMQSMKETDPSFSLIPVAHPVLKSGETPMWGQKDTPFKGQASTIITDKCENIEAAAIYMDYLYSEEGHMLANFGVEGESYEWVDGYPTYNEWITDNPDGWTMTEAMGAYNRANSAGPLIQDVRYMVGNYAKQPFQIDSMEIWGKSNVDMHQLPPLTPTPGESEEFAAIMSDINTYKDEMFLKYLFGQESLDTYDDYVANLESMGLAKAIELRQAALDRFNQR